jgi:hypothetical protein
MAKESVGGSPEAFDWGLHEEAENFIKKQLEVFRNRFDYANTLVTNMEQWTKTRLIDWTDHIVLSKERVNVYELVGMGYYIPWKDADSSEEDTVFHNLNSMLPPIILRSGDNITLALKTDSLDEFKQRNDLPGQIEGKEFGSYRTLQVALNESDILEAVERRGYNGFQVKEDGDCREYVKALESFERRNRDYSNEEDGYSELEDMIKDMQKTLDPNRIADAFFRVERKFWLEKNKAALFQKERQDAFGLGWANHDHLAFRSSRRNFANLIKILELLGLEPREAFYAGEQAGWGAQVMENRVCRIAIFADVDMNPEERDMDFAHIGLEPRDELGTIGLWVGLHGESLLQAGPHHLAIRCDFYSLKTDYEKARIGVMAPFSDFPFLKQAFTEGEPWMAWEKRILDMHDSKRITPEQHDRFKKKPAIGSHVEIIERNLGFAGFNQDSVSVIIKATDPRKDIVRGA